MWGKILGGIRLLFLCPMPIHTLQDTHHESSEVDIRALRSVLLLRTSGRSLPVPLGCVPADSFLKGSLSREIGRFVVRILRVGLHPFDVLPAVVGAIELIVAVYPTADSHQL